MRQDSGPAETMKPGNKKKPFRLDPILILIMAVMAALPFLLVRPPTRRCDSSTRARAPACCSVSAAASPASPAPMTITSGSGVAARDQRGTAPVVASAAGAVRNRRRVSPIESPRCAVAEFGKIKPVRMRGQRKSPPAARGG